VNRLNQKPNKKIQSCLPKIKDLDVNFTSKLISWPIHSKVYSEDFGSNSKLIEVRQFQEKNKKVT